MKGDQIQIATMNFEFWSLLVMQSLAELQVISGFPPVFMQVELTDGSLLTWLPTLQTLFHGQLSEDPRSEANKCSADSRVWNLGSNF